MKLYEPIYNDSLIDEVLRICGTTSAVYSNKATIARINAGLDRYWKLASDAANKGSFDDENQTALPVETQNLVVSTNAYKMSSFTNNILQILRVSVLDENGIERDLTYEEFDDIEDFNYTYSTTFTGLPELWTKIGDYIYLYPCPNYSEANGLRAYVSREMSKFTFVTFTTTNDGDLFNATGHGLVANDAVIFETDGTIPTGLTADTTVYYVISSGLTADVFKVSTTIGGTTINLTSDGTGNHKFIKVSKEPGIPVIHHPYLARFAALPFLIEKKLAQVSGIARLILQDEQGILDYWKNTNKESRTIIYPGTRNFK